MVVLGNRIPRKKASPNVGEGKAGGRETGRRLPVAGRSRVLGALVLALILAGPAADAWAGSRDLLYGSRNVSDGVLDSMRGGFFFGDMNFNFSFRSVTWINNTFQAETDLTLANNVVSDLKTLTSKPVFPTLSIGKLPGKEAGTPGPSGTPGNLVTTIQGSAGPSGTHNIQSSDFAPTPTPSVGPVIPKGPSGLNPISTLIQVGTNNSGVLGNAFSNSGGLNTVIQNNANNVLIQHLTQINGIIGNVGPVTHTTNMILRTTQSATLGSILSRF